MARTILVIVLYLVTGGVSARDFRKTEVPISVELLTEIEIDFDGDGGLDVFKLLRVDDKVMATVVFAGDSRSQSLTFSAADFACESSPETQGCVLVGASPEDIPLTQDSFADFKLMFDLPSTDVFVQAGTSHAVSVPLGDTDPFIFFWNAKTRRMDWLRL